MEIHQLSVPAVAGSLRVELPAGLPATGIFETWIGVDPASQPGTEVRFRVWLQTDSQRELWLELSLASGEGAGRWRLMRRRVKLPQDGASLLLEADLPRAADSSAPGLWGSPRLVFPPSDPQDRDRLNLLVIGIDTLRADAVGAWGGDDALTPELDRLAGEGIRFADLAAPSPWTLPSFATLFTGLHPQTHGAGRRLNEADRLRDLELSPLGSGPSTLASILSEAGYLSGGFYVNPFLGPAFGLDRGYDEYRGFPDRVRAGPVVDRAAAWLERNRDRPFFLFVHLFDPHTPYAPPAKVCEAVARILEPDFSDLPCQADRSHGSGVPPAERPWARALYRAEVAYTDSQVGRLLDALEELGLDDRTAVLLVSDHGEELWERPELAERPGYRAGADHGHSHFQELIRVPAVLRIPGIEPVTVDAAAAMADLLPTVLDYLGIEGPRVQGRSLRPLAEGHRLPEPLRLSDFLLYGRDRWAARRGPWKLVASAGDDPTLELYHLGRDPAERRDVAMQEPDVTRGLLEAGRAELERRSRLRRELAGADDLEPAAVSDEQRERLRALGYVQ